MIAIRAAQALNATKDSYIGGYADMTDDQLREQVLKIIKRVVKEIFGKEDGYAYGIEIIKLDDDKSADFQPVKCSFTLDARPPISSIKYER